jgi:uncharacterized protein (TIGR03067 family)
MSGPRIVIFVASVLLAGTLSIGGAADKEETGIQGKWTTEKFVWNGRESGPDEEIALVIDEKSVAWTFAIKMGNLAKAARTTYTYKVDPSKKPAEIDLIPIEGQFKGKAFPSIYQLDGNTLKLCRAQPGQRRPPEFSSKKGSDDVLLILKKSK